MNALSELLAQDYLVLDAIDEPSVSALRIVVRAARPQPNAAGIADAPVHGAVLVSPDATTPIFEVRFESYVGYLVRNESYAKSLPGESCEGGRAYRQYDSSEILDFMRRSTIASDSYPGPVRHYSLVCVDHIVDVISTVVPVVRPWAHQLDV
jgi:hypothetical protein